MVSVSIDTRQVPAENPTSEEVSGEPISGLPYVPVRLPRFTPVPEWLMERTEVSQGAKLAYGMLLREVRQSATGECRQSAAELARRLGIQVRQWRRYRSELEELGLIESLYHGPGERAGYGLLWHPWCDPQRTVPVSENPIDGWVYLLRGDAGFYKIGQSREPGRRIAQLQAAAHHELELVHVFQCADMAYEERLLHERFAEQRVRGEWFLLSEDDVAYIQGLKGEG